MSALFDQLTPEQQEEIRDYIRIIVKQDVLTTGELTIDDDGINRVLYDVHARFITNGVDSGDTIEFYSTTPPSITPVGTFLIAEVVDENTLFFFEDVIPFGVHTKYRIINTGGLQAKLNEQFSSLSTVLNVDKTEALRLEALNVPWYNRTTYVADQYFNEREGLDGQIFFYRVTQTDLDHVTLFPQPSLPPPFDVYGPLLYPFAYGRQTPDRRSGSVYTGLGTPALLGLPDTPAPPVGSYNYTTHTGGNVPSNAGERPAMIEEEAFYAGTSGQWPDPPNGGYQGDDVSRLTSIKNAQNTALTKQINAIDALIPVLDDELSDLRERGVTYTGLYGVISVARNRLTTARANAVYAQTNSTYGLPAITTSGPPTAEREQFINSDNNPARRRVQINTRISQILADQAPWIQMRYVMLNRRVNPRDGSLLLLRLANSRITDINEIVASLREERQTLNFPIGVNVV